MYKVFKFGEIDMAACANAALPYRFKQVFRKELFDFMGKDLKAEDFTSFAGEVLFIMHSAAKKADMNSLSFDDYIEFLLCQFHFHNLSVFKLILLCGKQGSNLHPYEVHTEAHTLHRFILF